MQQLAAETNGTKTQTIPDPSVVLYQVGQMESIGQQSLAQPQQIQQQSQQYTQPQHQSQPQPQYQSQPYYQSQPQRAPSQQQQRQPIRIIPQSEGFNLENMKRVWRSFKDELQSNNRIITLKKLSELITISESYKLEQLSTLLLSGQEGEQFYQGLYEYKTSIDMTLSQLAERIDTCSRIISYSNLTNDFTKIEQNLARISQIISSSNNNHNSQRTNPRPIILQTPRGNCDHKNKEQSICISQQCLSTDKICCSNCLNIHQEHKLINIKQLLQAKSKCEPLEFLMKTIQQQSKDIQFQSCLDLLLHCVEKNVTTTDQQSMKQLQDHLTQDLNTRLVNYDDESLQKFVNELFALHNPNTQVEPNQTICIDHKQPVISLCVNSNCDRPNKLICSSNCSQQHRGHNIVPYNNYTSIQLELNKLECEQHRGKKLVKMCVKLTCQQNRLMCEQCNEAHKGHCTMDFIQAAPQHQQLGQQLEEIERIAIDFNKIKNTVMNAGFDVKELNRLYDILKNRKQQIGKKDFENFAKNQANTLSNQDPQQFYLLMKHFYKFQEDYKFQPILGNILDKFVNDIGRTLHWIEGGIQCPKHQTEQINYICSDKLCLALSCELCQKCDKHKQLSLRQFKGQLTKYYEKCNPNNELDKTSQEISKVLKDVVQYFGASTISICSSQQLDNDYLRFDQQMTHEQLKQLLFNFHEVVSNQFDALQMSTNFLKQIKSFINNWINKQAYVRSFSVLDINQAEQFNQQANKYIAVGFKALQNFKLIGINQAKPLYMKGHLFIYRLYMLQNLEWKEEVQAKEVRPDKLMDNSDELINIEMDWQIKRKETYFIVFNSQKVNLFKQYKQLETIQTNKYLQLIDYQQQQLPLIDINNVERRNTIITELIIQLK